MAALGTSSLGLILFSFVVPALYFGLSIIVPAYRGRTPQKKFFHNLWQGLKNSKSKIYISVVFWGILLVGCLGISVVTTIYHDHRALVAKDRSLHTQLTHVTLERDNFKNRLAKAEAVAKRKPTAKVVPAPKKQCWNFYFRGALNPHVKGALTTTDVFLYCNYKVEAPYEIGVRFDSDDFIPSVAQPLYTPAGFMGGIEQKHGNEVTSVIQMPPLFADTALVVTVYSTTKKMVLPVAAGIRTIQ